VRLVQHYLIEAAQRFPEKTALICDKRRLSYVELIERMQGLSAMLADSGVQKGDRVLILLDDKTDFLLACYAVMCRGAIAVPLPEGITFPSVDKIISNCAPWTIITGRRVLARFPMLRDKFGFKLFSIEHTSEDVQAPAVTNMVVLCPDKMSHSGNHEGSVSLREDDGAMILFTSGASGKKGILLSHRNLISASLSSNEFMGIDPSIQEFVGVPFAHSFGLGRSRSIHFAGGTMVVNNGLFDPIGLVQSVLRNQCDAISAVPSGFAALFGRLESLLRRIGPQIRFIELGSAFMPLDHKLKLLDIFPNARVCMHYGLAEASQSTFLDFRREQRKLHTVGRAARGVSLLVSNDHGASVGQMEMGEVLIRGDHVGICYWNNDQLNSHSFTTDGWFRTGDYGFLDQDGYLHLLGRKDEMINMGGTKISPLEVEERIHEIYPDCEICVVGVPDPDGIVGEIPVLCYVSDGRVRITAAELSRVLALRLDRNKIPRVVYRVEHLPRMDNDKVSRRDVRKKIIVGDIHKLELVH
jgi:long-chain acyl-CoA synthetase